MKAIVINGCGTPDVLSLEEVPTPVPNNSQVLIKVAGIGVNYADIAQRLGRYKAPPGASVNIPGLEVSGIVTCCGRGVSRWKPGDEVCALIGGGAYAEYVVAEETQCLPKLPNTDFLAAAALPEAAFTIWNNVFQRGRLLAGETLLVHGGGSGIGTAAIRYASVFKAHVFATAGSTEKCKVCESIGAVKCINYHEDDFELALKDERIDVILDMVGGDYVPKNIRLLQPEGRLVFINALRGGDCSFDAWEILRKRLVITGSTLRQRDNDFKAELCAEVEKKLWPLIASGEFRPVIDSVFTLSEAKQAHERMESHEHIGKIILKVD